jgi:transposase InsO family protein
MFGKNDQPGPPPLDILHPNSRIITAGIRRNQNVCRCDRVRGSRCVTAWSRDCRPAGRLNLLRTGHEEGDYFGRLHPKIRDGRSQGTHPSADWIVQQLRETFPEAASYRYAILDHDSIFNVDVIAFLKATGFKPKRTSIQAPWQNGTAERWIGSCRREILDHIIPVNEEHLRRLIRDYVCYHHEDRIHDSLNKDTPNRRAIEPRPTTDASLISLPRLGGLHHRYTWRQAA